MAGHPRPLSPHLTIYRPQLTSLTSILHRLSGLALGLGALYLVCWLVGAAALDESFARLQAFNASILGRALLFFWSLAFFYHLLNGLRHLAWDAGLGLGLRAATVTGYLVLVGTPLLTLLVWTAAYYRMGAF